MSASTACIPARSRASCRVLVRFASGAVRVMHVAAVAKTCREAGSSVGTGSKVSCACDNVVCVLCEEEQREDCLARLHAHTAVCGGEPMGTCALGSLALASQATFCAEPTSDDLTRSHFYLAVQAGCVPVIFDGSGNTDEAKNSRLCDHGMCEPIGGLTGVARLPTPWAWRQQALLSKIRSVGGASGEAFMRRVNYSNFALSYYSADVLTGKHEGLAKHLLALATKPAHATQLMSLRRALEHVAPLMRWAPPTEPPRLDERRATPSLSEMVETLHAVRLTQ